MKFSLQFKDTGESPGTLRCEATVEFDLNLEEAQEALKRLQEAGIPSIIAKALSKKEPGEGDDGSQ